MEGVDWPPSFAIPRRSALGHPENTALAETHRWATHFRRHGYGCFALRGKGTMWPDGGGVSIRDITDGTSNTIMLVIVPYDGFNWFQPGDVLWDGRKLVFENEPARPVEFSPGMLVLADGSLRWQETSGPPAEVMPAMLGYKDGIPTESPTSEQDSRTKDD